EYLEDRLPRRKLRAAQHAERVSRRRSRGGGRHYSTVGVRLQPDVRLKADATGACMKTAMRGGAASYVHGQSNTALLGETIGQCFDRIVSRFPNHDALVSCHQELRLTYKQLHAEVDRVARGLVSLGVTRGDRVGIFSPNCAEWPISQYAAAKVGAILVNINP